MTKTDYAPVMAISLRKDGDHTIVEAEICGSWIEVIRERSDGMFSHIVEASGIMERYYSLDYARDPVNQPENIR